MLRSIWIVKALDSAMNDGMSKDEPQNTFQNRTLHLQKNKLLRATAYNNFEIVYLCYINVIPKLNQLMFE